MFKNALTAIGTAARELLGNRSALALFHLLYAGLLASLYLFFSTKEATLPQLVLTGLLALAAPLLFFILQAACVGYAGTDAGAGALLRRALRDFWKLILVSLPLVALAVLVFYLINKLQVRFPVPEAADATRAYAPYPQTPPPPPLRWQTFIFAALKLLLLGILVPLAGVHLWIATAREGFKATFRNFFRTIARAFSAPSVFIYTVGFVVFALMPYFLIYTRTGTSNGWLELAIFGLRLALAFVFTLWGWTITLGALTRISLDAGTHLASAATTTTNDDATTNAAAAATTTRAATHDAATPDAHTPPAPNAGAQA
ncbi:MAG TPA: hypothetical protein VNA19_02325 [Pyrinomonadaceae bacterium]|jgi:hypothetical protein|nr:hypothetical protein [Pyrinomonadaceae bacterium]